MYTPTKAQWQTVIENFQRVLPLAKREDHLNMDEYIVQEAGVHKCGTIHCVAGWYWVAVIGTNHPDKFIGFERGADLMAAQLGFFDNWEVRRWAARNPYIWGNDVGEFIFSDTDAYDGAKNLHEVIEFLTKVRDRSPE